MVRGELSLLPIRVRQRIPGSAATTSDLGWGRIGAAPAEETRRNTRTGRSGRGRHGQGRPGVRHAFLIHDRDSKFTDPFEEVFRSGGMRIVLTPIRAPNANAFCERWVGTLRAECLDWTLVFGRRHLERTLRTYIDHNG